MTKHFNAAFAMSFTHEEVVLEKHGPEGWRRLGAVRFTRGDLGQQLTVMREADSPVAEDAEAAQAQGPDTLLVIPDDQILYTTLTVPPGPEPALAVARALEGLTPYEVKDLAFDWAPAGEDHPDSLHIAAVARRTLDEAEAFALDQGFRPTGFIARPGDDRFPGQPDFGPSAIVRDLARRSAVTIPDLQRAGVTSGVIADAPASVTVTGPTVSRITAHVYPGDAAPVATAAPARPVMSEFAPTPERNLTVAPNGRDVRVGPVAPTLAVKEPRGEGAVIRHPAPSVQPTTPPAGGKILPPRAQAIHNRAAEARARRSEDKPAAPAANGMAALLKAARGLNGRMPGTFATMLGLLVLALVVTLLFFGGKGTAPTESQTAALPDPAVTQPQAEAATGAATGAPAEAAPVAAPVGDAPVIEDTTEPVDETELAAEPETPDRPLTLDPASNALATAPTVAQTPVAEAPVAEPTEAEALSERDAAVEAALAEAQGVAPAPTAPEATPVETVAAEAPAANEPAAAEPAPAATAPAPAPLRTLALTRSARPAAPPSRAAAPEATDAAPVVPVNPQPFAQRTEAAPQRLTAIRPPSRPETRPARSQPAAAPAAAPTEPEAPAAVAPAATQGDSLQRSTRPRSRPSDLSMNLLLEGSDDGQRQAVLTQAEIDFLQAMLRDLRTAQAGNGTLSEAERGAVILLAQARPQRRPVDVGASSQRAVDNAVAAAMSGSPPPPARQQDQDTQQAAASPTATGGLSRSARPLRRPGAASTNNGEVEKAIAAAVASGPLAPGAVALTALSSSPLPPRRSAAAATRSASLVATAATAPVAAAAAAATPSQPSAADQAAIEEQRREDAALQAQAEARARDRAAADARAESQARAAAEARARAQAQAEAQAAAARNQTYTPPEAENEPEVATNIPRGSTAATVASAATVKDGITINRTQIIGTIGAGKGSRALVRLSNGRVITLRLGDRINGGTITAIGNSRITYVKGGRSSDLAVLDGR